MESVLSQQLQQAWLDIQMRKKQQKPDSSSPSPSVPELIAPPTSSVSFSMPIPDTALTASIEPIQPQQKLSDGELCFRDPVLQYISDILMEEDMDDRKCMMQECSSYHATAKGFYDILGAGGDLPFVCCHGKDCPSISADTSVLDNESLKHSPAGEHPVRVGDSDLAPECNCVMGPISNADEEDNRWKSDLLDIKGLANNESNSAASMAVEVMRQLALPRSSDACSHSRTNNSFMHQDPSCSLVKGPVCNSRAMHPTLLPLEDMDNDKKLTEIMMQRNKQHTPSSARKGDASHGFAPKKSLRSSSLDSSPMPIKAAGHLASAGRSKRAVSHGYSAAEGFQVSLTGNLLRASSSATQEEVISYVKNEDLNAEGYARALNEGLPLMADEVHNFRRSTTVEHKDTWVVDTSNDFKGLLIACAQAVEADDIRRAHEILKEVRHVATPFGNAEQRLAHYFAEGLVARLSGTGGRLYSAFTNNRPSASKMLKAHHLFVEICPFVKVSHYFANKAILEVAEGASRLHIVDYGILYGLQWPCLISALAEQEGGPPSLRLTGIDFPQPGIKAAERVEVTGRRLSEYAKTYGVPFEYHAIASKWENIQPSSLHLRQDEVLVVNSMFRLHHLPDETVLASNPRKEVLTKIRAMKPKVFLQGINNGGYNSPFFMSRFKEALSFFSNTFDMMDWTVSSDNQERMMIEREVVGRDILNVVSCDGLERVVRPETYKQWENRTRRAGFEQKELDQDMLREAQSIVKATYDKNFDVDQDGSWMLLSWKGHVSHGLSQWRPNGK